LYANALLLVIPTEEKYFDKICMQKPYFWSFLQN
jgi:hypothetical protein